MDKPTAKEVEYFLTGVDQLCFMESIRMCVKADETFIKVYNWLQEWVEENEDT